MPITAPDGPKVSDDPGHITVHEQTRQAIIAAAELESEVTAARDGEATLLDKINLLEGQTGGPHSSTHAEGGADPVTLSQAQITNLSTDLASKTPQTRTIATSSPLSGGGDLSGNRTLSVSDFTGDSGAGGTRGTVPAPAAGDAAADKYLHADGSWSTVVASGGSGHEIARVQTGGTPGTVALTDRAQLLFSGNNGGYATLYDDPTNDRTIVNLPGIAPAPVSGSHYFYPLMNGRSVGGVLNRMYLVPIQPWRHLDGSFGIIDKVHVEVTTAHASGVIRVGLYDGIVGGNRRADWGTVSASTTGVKTITLGSDYTWTADAMHYVAVVIQGGAAQLAFGNTFSATQYVASGVSTPPFPPGAGAYDNNTVSGALPSYGGTSTTESVLPWVALQIPISIPTV